MGGAGANLKPFYLLKCTVFHMHLALIGSLFNKNSDTCRMRFLLKIGKLRIWVVLHNIGRGVCRKTLGTQCSTYIYESCDFSYVSEISRDFITDLLTLLGILLKYSSYILLLYVDVDGTILKLQYL